MLNKHVQVKEVHALMVHLDLQLYIHHVHMKISLRIIKLNKIIFDFY